MKYLLTLLLLLPSTSFAGNVDLKAQKDGSITAQVKGGDNITLPSFSTSDCANNLVFICSGTFATTVSGFSGLSSVTPFTSSFLKVGNQVSACIRFNTDPSGVGDKVFRASLPITGTDFTSSSDLQGTGTVSNGAGQTKGAVEVSGDSANDNIAISYRQASDAGGATTYPVAICFKYVIK